MKGSSDSGAAKAVAAASFGYVKKNAGHSPASSPSGLTQRGVSGVPTTLDIKRHDALNGYKTANVTPVAKLIHDRPHQDGANRSLERPKTRLKVSGGTQTDLAGSAPRKGQLSIINRHALTFRKPRFLTKNELFSTLSLKFWHILNFFLL